MKKSNISDDQYALAVYMLKNRFHNVMDLIKFWSFSGPCLESHPEIEDYNNTSRWPTWHCVISWKWAPLPPFPPLLYTYIVTIYYILI